MRNDERPMTNDQPHDSGKLALVQWKFHGKMRSVFPKRVIFTKALRHAVVRGIWAVEVA